MEPSSCPRTGCALDDAVASLIDSASVDNELSPGADSVRGLTRSSWRTLPSFAGCRPVRRRACWYPAREEQRNGIRR